MARCKKRDIAELVYTTCKQQREGWTNEEILDDIIIKFFEENKECGHITGE